MAAQDLQERHRKLRDAYASLAPPRRTLEPSRVEGFFERLLEDAAKRRAKAEKLAQDKVSDSCSVVRCCFGLCLCIPPRGCGRGAWGSSQQEALCDLLFRHLSLLPCLLV